MLLGRWQEARTARLYLNEGMATLAEMHFEPIRKFLLPFQRAFTQTPLSSYQTLEPLLKSRSGGRGKDAKKGKSMEKSKPKKAKRNKKGPRGPRR